MIKKSYKKTIRFFLALFNLFYIPFLSANFRKKINQLPEERQIFLMTRMDFGTFLYMLHYARCWEELRGKTCIVILTPRFKEVKELVKHISPNTLLIAPDHFILRLALKIFGVHNIHERTLFPVHSLLKGEYPYALHLFDSTARSCYIPYFDQRIKKSPPVSDSFLAAYYDIRRYLNVREETMLDFFHLHCQSGLSKRTYAAESLPFLKKELAINGPYVVMNLNCKTYKEKGTDRKRILHPERYNCAIDYLIEKGFTVVIQGREEQPLFSKRKGLVDYAKSGFGTPEHDLALYSGSYFAIVNKTGPESFCTICNTPQLGLNYSELINLTPHMKLRFFPKHIYNKGLDCYLTWKEYLLSPAYFDLARYNYDPNIECYDLSEEEIIEALEEFLPLVESEKWLDYTPEQKEFKSQLHPMHLDLYDVKGVPCNAYLSGKKKAHPIKDGP